MNDFTGLFVRRASRFCSSNDLEIGSIFQIYRSRGKLFKCCIISAHLFTILNGWCTPPRFGRSDMLCPYCAFDLAQDIGHLVVCPSLQNCVFKFLNQPSLFLTIEHIVKFRSCNIELGPDSTDLCLLFNYVGFFEYNMSRHGETLSVRLIAHICKRLCLHCPRSRALTRKLKSTKFDFPVQ